MFRNLIGWLLIVIVLIFLIWGLTIQQNKPKKLTSSFIAPPINQSTKLPSQVRVFPADPFIGSKDAELTIIEFGDFQCLYCAQSAAIIAKAMNDNPGKIKLIWKDFPLPGSAQAQTAAEAAQCANRQGKFWQYHDALFSHQDNLNSNLYLSIAGEIGLNIEGFNRCLNNRETLPLIQLNIKEGQSIGVDGTPYFIINGEAFSGLITSEQIKILLE